MNIITAPRDSLSEASMPLTLQLSDPASGITLQHDTTFRGPE